MNATQSPPSTTTTTSPPTVTHDVQPPEINKTDDVTLSFQDYAAYGLSGAMTFLGLIWDYLTNPGVILTHVVTIYLLYGLTKKGTQPREAIRAGIVQELVTIVLWYLVPNSFATIGALFVTIYLYGILFGPKVVVRQNAQILSSDDIACAIREANPDLKFECVEDASEFRTSTFLQYVVHSRSQWGADTSEYEKGIALSDIKSVHSGYDDDIARTVRSLGANSRSCFFVTLNEGKLTATFVASDAQTRNHWLHVLEQLCCTTVGDIKSIWLEKSCKQAGIEQRNGDVQLEQLESILAAAKRLTDRPYLAELFKTKLASKANDMLVDVPTLHRLFDEATFRPECEIIFEKIMKKGKGDKIMEALSLCQFLNEDQKQPDVDTGTARKLIQAHETVLPSHKLTMVGFTNYMLSHYNSVFNYQHRNIYQDMDQPLSHYFISTSHNTYLTKDQLKSKSSVEMYSNALKRGCRCVELDTWDGPNNEPVIYHGRTLTSKILFKDVISTVRDHAFTASEYPVILSFENHCSVEQQKVIASHLISILGDRLYTKPIPEDEKQNPSPNDLKGYVIVKYKKLKTGQDLAYDEDSDDDDEDDDCDDEDAPGTLVNGNYDDGEDDESSQKRGSVKSIMDVMRGMKGKKGKKEEIPKIAQELSDLVIYFQSVKFKGFDYAREKSQYYEMSSIGEKKALKLIKDESLAFLEYNSRQICRTYPAGNRIDSSNYDPHQLWNVGAQMVALNFQTHDRPMQIHQGLFQDNGGCGYILKPEFMRGANLNFDARGTFPTYTPLNIQIISGHQLPYNNEKNVRAERALSVMVRISGADADAAKEKTKNVKNNGFRVVWSEVLKFRVCVPELALVQFTVREGNDTFLGQYSLPFRCLQQGHRNVSLWSKSSSPISHASLFIHVNIGEPAAVE